MNTESPPDMTAAGPQVTVADDVIRTHMAFCLLALPMRSGASSWQRDVANASVRFDESDDGQPGPSGVLLRQLMHYICDFAIRHETPVINTGDSAQALAIALGLDAAGPDTEDLAEQFERLLACRMSVSWRGGPMLPVFDARGRTRIAPGWRHSLRLNARFLVGLMDAPVTLSRATLRVLDDSPLALDAAS